MLDGVVDGNEWGPFGFKSRREIKDKMREYKLHLARANEETRVLKLTLRQLEDEERQLRRQHDAVSQEVIMMQSVAVAILTGLRDFIKPTLKTLNELLSYRAKEKVVKGCAVISSSYGKLVGEEVDDAHRIPAHTIPYYTIPYHTIPYHAMSCHATPYHTMPYYTTPYLFTP